MIEGRTAGGAPVRVEVAGDRIAAVTPLRTAPDLLLLPGLVDLQVNGYGGHDFNGADAEPAEAVRALWRRGTTTLCPTVITAPEAAILASLRAIARARERDPLIRQAIPAIHVEGPYLSHEDGPRGAHDAAALRDPDLAEFDRWQEACGGLVRIVTLAPERRGALAYIEELSRRGVIVAIGHTAATPERVTAAVAAGARLSTHLGNGAHRLLPRHPNHLWTQLADDRLTASLIADGHHLPSDTFTAMLRAKGPGRSVLVSDSVALAGCAPGDYDTPVGGRITAHPDGRLTLPGGDLLAGSGSSLMDCVAWAAATGLGLAEAVTLATTAPARLLGRTDLGRLTPGARADLVVATPDLSIRRTYVNGEVVFHA
ncbi:N-acetylglucosamine-6-phosphate deacetylase [Nonomuraea longicatena]|uniref:N-acetylglucosamine-6-phosphate deacetylase n=1 Tax=Nonomuraea longicatena TaxID=83682 RepID=UPI0031CE4836